MNEVKEILRVLDYPEISQIFTLNVFGGIYYSRPYKALYNATMLKKLFREVYEVADNEMVSCKTCNMYESSLNFYMNIILFIV